MSITFNSNWKTPDPWYVAKYGPYKTFLDSTNRQQVMCAMWNAEDKFSDGVIRQMLSNASSNSNKRQVTVEQGLHQTENYTAGGFTLHLTVRDANHKAFHLYIAQHKNGAIWIKEISYFQGGLHNEFAKA